MIRYYANMSFLIHVACGHDTGLWCQSRLWVDVEDARCPPPRQPLPRAAPKGAILVLESTELTLLDTLLLPFQSAAPPQVEHRPNRRAQPVDLDLDVIKMASEHLSDPLEWMAAPGETFVDDEDEFEEHRVAFNYPDGVVTAAQTTCEELKRAVRAGVAPYDGTHERWLAELTRLAAS